jgi:uncharacterized Zn-binding protein involved in type VI secretion
MNRRRWFAVCAIVAAVTFVARALHTPSPLAAQQDGPPVSAKVYVYPEKLTAKDKLSFGPSEEQKKTIPIKGEATLVYVDLMPNARFAHPTQCILISTDGARVIKGDWWLILNGKPLFRDGKDLKVDFPMVLSGK